MDDLDRAQLADSRFLALALAMQAQETENRQGSARNHCLECECIIPKARRKAMPGCERCVRCEQENETLKRR